MAYENTKLAWKETTHLVEWPWNDFTCVRRNFKVRWQYCADMHHKEHLIQQTKQGAPEVMENNVADYALVNRSQGFCPLLCRVGPGSSQILFLFFSCIIGIHPLQTLFPTPVIN